MDPRRKKIYIVLIICCLVLSAGILGWTYFGTGSSSSDVSNTPIPTSTPVATGNPETGFLPPAVFPASSTFKTDVLESSAFKQLKDYPPVDVAGQLGRPDPFRSY